MNKKKILLFSFLLIILIIFFLNYKEDKNRNYNFIKDRIFNKIKIKKIKEVEHSFSSTDYLVSGNYIYLKDFPKQQIIKIDYNGNLIDRYGKKGEGPKESLMVRAFDIDSVSYKFIDANKNSYARVSFKNELLKFFKSKTNINTGSFLKNNKLIIKGAKGKFGKRRIKFSIIDLKSDSEKEITLPNIFNNMDNSDWIYDGFFIKTVDNGAIYATHFSNIFLKFDSNGNLIYNKQFIYKVPQIKLSVVGKTLFPIENDHPNYYSLTSNDKYILFLTSIGDSNHRNSIIVDVYNYNNGNYHSSFSIEKDKKNNSFPNIIRLFKNKLFVFYDDKFKIYEIKEN